MCAVYALDTYHSIFASPFFRVCYASMSMTGEKKDIILIENRITSKRTPIYIIPYVY